MNKEEFCSECAQYEDYGGFDDARGAPCYAECWECRLGEEPDSEFCRRHDEWLDLNNDDMEPLDEPLEGDE